MDNILFNYFENRYKEANSKLSIPKKFGPVITISRQAGCEARKVGFELIKELNKFNPKKPWRCVDKEILEKSAKELNLTTSKIEHFYKGSEKSSFIDMFVSFSKSYVNDLKIKHTIKDVMQSVCKQGYIVLVGRAGAAILQDKPNCLNIRLTAPFMWRIDTIIKNRQIPLEEAEEWAIDTDDMRYRLFYQFLEKRPANLEYLFHATLNRKHYSIPETVHIIKELARIKGVEI